jgi:hypothetical protein
MPAACTGDIAGTVGSHPPGDKQLTLVPRSGEILVLVLLVLKD